ncbi:ABC transporter permease [Actinoplanes sp. CA-142083]|uniref:ABC transporter permease n=1 Tax=Actinoplanes sp. CA-142083 TaxID=3239903 RepID=UPI003D9332B4
MTVTSAYPRDLADLLPAARTLAKTVSGVPSRNRLMRELRIGAPKAQALRSALLAEPTVSPLADPVSAYPSARADVNPIIEAAEINAELSAEITPAVHPGTEAEAATAIREPRARKRAHSLILFFLAAPAFVAIWSGWVGLGGLTGFGVVHPLPGIWDSLSLNTAITLPIGVEAYAAYALRVWLSGGVPRRARRFAAVSAVASLILGAAGQVAYHLMTSAGITSAPWQITTLVACLPVAVLGMGAALAHLVSEGGDQ